MCSGGNEPYSLKDSTTRELRAAALALPHMVALKHYVECLRAELRSDLIPNPDLPDFDPCDGGVHARCLFLLESPGRQARSTGFVSMNNPDPTAANWLSILREATVPRDVTALWNAVPWYVGDTQRLGRITAAHVKRASNLIPGLIHNFPQLQAVVFVGRNSARLMPAVSEARPDLKLLRCPHPSQQNLNCRPEARSQMLTTLKDLQALLPIEASAS